MWVWVGSGAVVMVVSEKEGRNFFFETLVGFIDKRTGRMFLRKQDVRIAAHNADKRQSVFIIPQSHLQLSPFNLV